MGSSYRLTLAATAASLLTAQAGAQETVIVEANGSQVELPADYAGDQIARGGRIGLFGNLDIMDTPFDTTNYTAEYIRNLQASSVADVVLNDPGVRVARGFGNFQELYVVRGFPVYSDDVAYNGLYGLLPRQYVAAEFLERLEVFRGANTFLNGAAPGGSGIGGEFNLVPKRAPDVDVNRLTVGYENQTQGYAAGDLSRRFGEDRQFGVRVNAARRDGEDSIDNEDLKLSMASIGADYHTQQAKVSVDLGWQDHHIDAPRPSVTPSGAVPAPPDASSNFAQRWSYTEEHDVLGVARGEYDFTDTLKVWAASGFRKGTEHNILANPTSDPDGVLSSYRFDNYRKDLITTSEIGARGEVTTFGVLHRISATGSVYELNSKNAYGFSSFSGFPGDLYNPTQSAPPTADFFTGGVLLDPKTTSLVKTESIALADMLSFVDDTVRLMVGGRFQRLQQYSYDYDSGDRLAGGYDKKTVTPAVGLVVKPTKQVSLYVNYIEALVQGDQAPEVSGATPISNAGEIFAPFRSRQYEVGAKFDTGTLGGTLALFRVNKPSPLIVGTVYTHDGEQRNQGIELSWYGEVTSDLKILGGVTVLDTEVLEALDSTSIGKRVTGVPDAQANLGLEWAVPVLRGLTLDGHLVYTGSESANVANTTSIPASTRLDLGGRYGFTFADKLITARASVENVTDKDYWSSVGGEPGANYLVLAEPRTFKLSLSVDL